MIITKKLTKIISASLLCLAVGFAVSCGEEEEEEEETSGELDGTWVGDCSYKSDDDESEIETITFSGTSFTRSSVVHSGDGCVAANEFMQFSMTGPIVYGASDASPKTIDITINSLDITLTNSTMVTDANAGTLFGHADWELDVAKTFTEPTADLDFVGDTMYEIYEVSNNTVCWGEDVDDTTGDSADTRATAISADECLTKQ